MDQTATKKFQWGTLVIGIIIGLLVMWIIQATTKPASGQLRENGQLPEEACHALLSLPSEAVCNAPGVYQLLTKDCHAVIACRLK